VAASSHRPKVGLLGTFSLVAMVWESVGRCFLRVVAALADPRRLDSSKTGPQYQYHSVSLELASCVKDARPFLGAHGAHESAYRVHIANKCYCATQS